LAGLVALGVIVLIRRRHTVGKILSANWAILLFLVYCLVSVYWSDFPLRGIQKVDQVLRRLGDGFGDPERSRLASGTQKNSRLAGFCALTALDSVH